MAMKDFEAKQFMLEKGERVGLGVALFLLVVLILYNLFLPPNGFFSGSSSANAKVLADATERVQHGMNTNEPKDADKPPPIQGDLTSKYNVDFLRPEEFRLKNELFTPANPGSSKRGLPEVLLVKDAAVDANIKVRIPVHIFNTLGGEPVIMVLEGSGPGPAGGGGRDFARRVFGGGKMGGPGGGPGPGGGGTAPGMPGRGTGYTQRVGRLVAPGMGGPGGMGMPGGMAGLTGNEEVRTKWVPLNKLGDAGTERLAKEVKPLRMVMIVAGFPYKEQVEQFRDKLHLRSVDEVLSEQMEEKDKDKDGYKVVLPAFRFLGVDVERQTLDPSGEVLVKWEKLDLDRSYLPLVFQTGKNFEEEDPKYDPIAFDGLVMPRLKLFHPDEEAAGGGTEPLVGGPPLPPGAAGGRFRGTTGTRLPADADERGPGRAPRAPRDAKDTKDNPDEPSYPDGKLVETLKSLKTTLQAIKDKDPKEIRRPPANFDIEGFNLFVRDQGEATGDMMPGGMMPGGRPGFASPPGVGGRMRSRGDIDSERMGRGGGKFPGRPGGPGAPGVRPGGPGMPGEGMMGDLEEDIPEYCMVRLMDVDVKPGKVYQYRLQVRMANPNYNRTDVASTAYRKEKEIKSDWYEVPQKAVVPPELLYYAVDQKDLDRNTREQPPVHRRVRDENRADPDQVVLQAHRWLLGIPFKDSQPIPVGDWVVAERMLVHRGEVIGRNERVEVPVWRPREGTMALLKETSAKRGTRGVEVDFGYGTDQEAVLVDFEGGKCSYDRVVARSEDPDQKPTTRKINDESSTDVLILSPDGKLMARNSAADAKDEERVKRLKEVREKIAKWADESKALNNLLNNPAGAGGRGERGSPFGDR